MPNSIERCGSRRSKCFHAAFSAWLLIPFLLAGVLGTPAFAKETSESRAPVKLEGGVVKVEVSLNDLRDARLSVSRVRKATANLYDEVTRQPMTMTYNPNIIGTTVISVPMPVFSEQTLPPRKKWVTASMNEISPIMNLFKEDVDIAIESNRRVEVSDQTREELDPLRGEVFATVKSSFDIYKQLADLTAGPVYDNEAIASASKSLDSEMKKLDKSLKKGISLLQKEAKSANKKVSQTQAVIQ